MGIIIWKMAIYLMKKILKKMYGPLVSEGPFIKITYAVSKKKIF
jgi:hypothetical protein